MTAIYTSLKQERTQSPRLVATVSTAGPLDQASDAKEQHWAVTPSLSIMTSATLMDIDIKTESGTKAEHTASPSQSPTLVSESTGQKFKASRSPTPPTVTVKADTTPRSNSATPPITAPSKGSKKAAAPVQLIGDLPVSRTEALASFNEISDNNYQFKSLGRSREILESMSCDCTYEHGSSTFFNMNMWFL